LTTGTSPSFVPGIALARSFFDEAVRPVLASVIPGVRFSAGLIGPGSEVLGLDTDRSTDHHWGPRCLVFLDANDLATHGPTIDTALADALPTAFHGWSTNFGPADEVGVRLLASVERGPVAHRVELHEPAAWFTHVLGFDPADGVTLDDWLATPTQLLLSVTAGAVFHDGLDALGPRRRTLAWYPRDVWLYVLGCQWQRIAQEEAFVGRAGEVGDDLGSRIVAARLARDLVRLAFVLERQYPPYSKWLGTAFDRLACAGRLRPLLSRALAAQAWQRREAALGAAAELLGGLHNALCLTAEVDTTLRPFHDRPFLVLDARRFADACFAAIDDAEVARIPRGVGAVDQWVDNTDVLSQPHRLRSVGPVRPGRAGE
jgi:hypothetical protein